METSKNMDTIGFEKNDNRIFENKKSKKNKHPIKIRYL